MDSIYSLFSQPSEVSQHLFMWCPRMKKSQRPVICVDEASQKTTETTDHNTAIIFSAYFKTWINPGHLGKDTYEPDEDMCK